MTTDFELMDIHSDDIDDVLRIVEKSFNFNFDKTDLKDVKTFGDLCDIIVDKVQLDNSDDCTTQKAFYKLRDAFKSADIDVAQVTPDTQLESILPRQFRRQRLKQINSRLGYSLKILRPPSFVTAPLIIALLASIIGLFFLWKVALAGFILTAIALRIADKFGNELDNITIGQLAEKMTRENYLK